MTSPSVLCFLTSGVSLCNIFLHSESGAVPRGALFFVILKPLQSSILQKENNIETFDNTVPPIVRASPFVLFELGGNVVVESSCEDLEVSLTKGWDRPAGVTIADPVGMVSIARPLQWFRVEARSAKK